MVSNNTKIDYELCDATDLKENEMKDFTVNHNDKSYRILLTKYQNEFYAIGNKCSHYSLPLSNGVLYKGRIRCFAHGACFNVKTGDIEDFPGHDCLPSYKIQLNKTTNKVHLTTTIEELEQKFRIKTPKQKQITSSSKKIIIIGSGAASLECVETLREEGVTTGVTIITSESYTPYDRPKLSKAFDLEIEKITLRDENFYKENNIGFIKNHPVKAINANKRQIECENGRLFDYDKLVIATGLIPTKHRPVPGADLNGIFTLRSFDDSKRILQYLTTKKRENLKVLIIGTSFVALESATYFTGKASVTVICRRLPFSSHFGKQAAEKIVKLHESKGVKFIMDSKLDVVEFRSSVDDVASIASAIMTDGSSIDADICLVAIGSRPATSFIKDCGVNMNAAGYIIVDKYMRTNVEDVYAVGDLVVFPRTCIKVSNDGNKNDLINVPHWQMSHMHGRIAAYSLLERGVELSSIPFFWSLNHGKTVRFAGFNDKYDEILFHEDVGEKKNVNKFVAFYILESRVVAVASCDWDPICATVAELMYNDVFISRDCVLSDPWGVKALMV
jgi:NADPH-dependent 2,4-dienoyl-CoA reductase/sulfur reductase-like enzyme/nitrite reductase/ring-hydroxylating ferredoxin subunit